MEVFLRKIHPKEIIGLMFLIGIITGSEEKENIKATIKKCCPKGQELNSALMCVNVTRDLEKNKVNNTEEAGNEPPYFINNPSKIHFPDYKNSSGRNESTLEKLLPWFPFASLISSVTLERITDWGSIKDLFEDENFEFGSRPECDADEKEFGCFRPTLSEQFYVILYPRGHVELYVSKKSSYHGGRQFKIESRDCGFSKSDPGENNTDGKESGDLLWKPPFIPRRLRTFPLEDFCLEKGPEESFLVEYCPCKTVPCIRKCCRDSELYDSQSKKCVRNSTFGYWRPFLENSTLTKNYYLLPSRHPSTCENPLLLREFPTEEINSRRKCGSQQEERNKFHFLFDGSLQGKNYDVPVGSYCGDHVIYGSGLLSENNFLICPSDDDESAGKYKVYGIFFIVGGLVLAVTVAICSLLTEMRTSLFGQIVLSHNVLLMLAAFIWGSSSLLSKRGCALSGLAIQYALLGSFFWMNVLCWDVFLGKRSFSSRIHKHRFLTYAAYACGAPAIIVCITAAMEFGPSLPSHYVRPGFDCHCGFDPDSDSILFYLYGPMLAIILINFTLFFWTLGRGRSQNRERIENEEENKCDKRFVTFSKFFLLVQLSWVMEIVGWLFKGKDYYWYFPDFLSILRALFIFIVFVWKEKVLRSLLERLEGCWKGSDGIGRDSGSEADLAEMKRRERILRKQITQTFRMSDECEF